MPGINHLRLLNLIPVLRILLSLGHPANHFYISRTRFQNQTFNRSMSGGVSCTYAAAVSTPNGDMRQPQIQARACSDPDMRSSYEKQSRDETTTKPHRPGAGLRAKTSFRGWTKKGKETIQNPRGVVQELQCSQKYQSPHSSREEFCPKTGNTEEYVYVLTLKLDETLSQPMNQMREQYFPHNRTPAHLTLFHALPHSQLEAIDVRLSEVARNTRAFQVTTGGPFRMRRGIGVKVDAGYQKMRDVHALLQLQWLPFLSEQDAGGFRPHWTVMNKVDDEKEVDQVFRTVRSELATNTHEGHAIGFDLWKYEQGRWAWESEYVFDNSLELLTSTRAARSQSGSAGHSTGDGYFARFPRSGASDQRPGLKRGSSVAEAWRSMSFRHRS